MKALSAFTTVALLALAAPAQASVCPEQPGQDMHVGADGLARPASDPALPPADLPALAPETRDLTPRAAARPRVKRLLRKALLDDRITPEQHDAHVASYDAAVGTWRRLGGVRKAQLGAQIANLDRIARRGAFTPSRFHPLFLQLDRNREFWAENGLPRAKPGVRTACGVSGGGGGLGRVTFEGSEVVFQYYAGQGLQIHPLASFGKANQLWNACEGLNTEPGTPCELERLRLLLDEMHAIASTRGSFRTWEYFFSFGGGLPPWTSGLSQGTGIQAMARGSELLGDPKYARQAREALGAFEVSPPVGVRVYANGGRHYLIYSFSPGLRVLNGFLQALIGLHDYAKLEDSPKAWALFRAGERAARREVPRFDTGAWSLYSQGGAESDLSYHRLVRDFLRGLCERTQSTLYCRKEKRFTGYLYEATRVRMGVSSRARAKRLTYIRFVISKRSCVSLVISRGKRVISSRTTVFPYGRHSWAFVPPSAGTYTVKLDARDSRNHHTVVERTLRVRGRG